MDSLLELFVVQEGEDILTLFMFQLRGAGMF